MTELGYACLEPVIISEGQRLAALMDLFMDIGVNEKHWPAQELRELFHWPDAKYTGVFLFDDNGGEIIVGGTQLLDSHRPYPIEKIFPSCIQGDEVVVEVGFTAIRKEYRSMKLSGFMSVLDALFKGILLTCPENFTDIYAILDSRILSLYNRLRLPFKRVSDPVHYWCGTDRHGDDCVLAFACRLNHAEADRLLAEKRPAYFQYLYTKAKMY